MHMVSATQGIVSGMSGDGHSFQRHLRPAVAEAARYRILSQRQDARRQASPRHGQSRAQPAVRSGRDRRGQPAATRQGRAAGPGRSPEGKMPVAGAVELGDGNAPGRLRLATIRCCSAKDLGNFAVRNTAATAIVKTDGWRGCSAVPRPPCRRRQARP